MSERDLGTWPEKSLVTDFAIDLGVRSLGAIVVRCVVLVCCKDVPYSFKQVQMCDVEEYLSAKAQLDRICDGLHFPQNSKSHRAIYVLMQLWYHGFPVEKVCAALMCL